MDVRKLNQKNISAISAAEKSAFLLYNMGWNLAIPLLRINSRIKDGFEQRILKQGLPAADLWIQAASAGEAYLAWNFVKNLRSVPYLRILITSNTRQGIEILARAADDIMRSEKGKKIFISYFPFDKPAIMKKAVKEVRPKLMILLETEIWPGLMMALKNTGCRIVIINGRITLKSFNRYILWHSLFSRLSPDKIFAVSAPDAKRFALLFGKELVATMPNMKFDRLNSPLSDDENRDLNNLLPSNTPFVVLGSVRSEEEDQVQEIILHLLKRRPDIIIGLFPRHMHRIGTWEERLNHISATSVLRSKIDKKVFSGTVILWDVFGELRAAYGISTAAFVGGSLAPLGGQNFLEAVVSGVVPVIGPYWDNFAWIGDEIFEKGLVTSADNTINVIDMLEKNINKPEQRDKVRNSIGKYIKERQGGTEIVCSYVEKVLKEKNF
jgi:3-deoxy-D-manno-octulosonic-acid transferase